MWIIGLSIVQFIVSWIFIRYCIVNNSLTNCFEKDVFALTYLIMSLIPILGTMSFLYLVAHYIFRNYSAEYFVNKIFMIKEKK